MASTEGFDGILADSIWVRDCCPPRHFPLLSLPDELLLNVTRFLDCHETVIQPCRLANNSYNEQDDFAKLERNTLQALKKVSRKLEAIAIEEESRRLTFDWKEDTHDQLKHDPSFARKIERFAASLCTAICIIIQQRNGGSSFRDRCTRRPHTSRAHGSRSNTWARP
jgi:hypothetical protein